MGHIWLATCFVNIVSLDHSALFFLHIPSGWFCVKMWVLRNSNTENTTCRTWNIYYLALFRKSFPLSELASVWLQVRKLKKLVIWLLLFFLTHAYTHTHPTHKQMYSTDGHLLCIIHLFKAVRMILMALPSWLLLRHLWHLYCRHGEGKGSANAQHLNWESHSFPQALEIFCLHLIP